MTQTSQAESSASDNVPNEQHLENPYVGPRPFTVQDRGRFYGRDVEANQLLSLVIAERLVLFNAQSGAGKSSLINARLIPGLEERNFQILTGRVSGQSVTGSQPGDIDDETDPQANIFTQNLLLSLEHNAGRDNADNAQKVARMTLSEYLSGLSIDPAEGAMQLTVDKSEPGQMLLDAPQVFSGVHPLALIIDQFEEIFTTNPGAWRQRKPFFDQLREAMEKDPYLWVVLVIREDYVAALDPFANLLPGRLRARFYMQRMNYGSGLEAVIRPVEGVRPFEKDAANELVTNLSLITIGKDEENQPVHTPGQYIEPVQLQVVCFQLWEALRGQPGSTIQRQDLQSLTAGKDLAAFISDALALFYVNALSEVQKQYPETSERKLRDFFSNELITEAETRSAVVEGKQRTGSQPFDLPNEVVHALQARFIIRTEIRGENTWYELSHDRFVAPILQSNRAWAEKNSFPLEAAAKKWMDGGKDPSLLYDGRQLNDALALLAKNPDEVSETAKQFVQFSQDVARTKERRRQRIAFAVLSTLLFVAVALAIVAGYSASMAVQQRSTAEVASTQAIQQRLLVETASTAVVQQRERAVEQQVTAEAASTLAIQQQVRAEAASTAVAQERERAVEQQQIAEAASTLAVQQEQIAKTAEAQAMVANIQSQASRLSSLANFFQNSRPDLSMLLAIRAVDVFDSWESRQSLLTSLQRRLATQVEKSDTIFMGNSSPGAIAFSPNGRYLAAGLGNGSVQLIGIDGQSTNRTIAPNQAFGSEVLSLAFNSNGDTLAIAGNERDILLWHIGESANLDTYEKFQVFPVTGFYYSFRVVAFQPGGNFIALATNQATEEPGRSGKIFLVDLKNLKAGPQFTDECPRSNCTSMAWSPDGSKLAVGDSSGNLKILRIAEASQPTVIWQRGKAHTDQVRGLVWYTDNQRLVSGGIDHQLLQWDISIRGTAPILISDRNRTPPIFGLAISPSGRYIVAAGNDPGLLITVWDADTLERRPYPGLENPHNNVVLAVAFSTQGNLFASASADNFINLWAFNPIDPLGTPEWLANEPGLAKAVAADEQGNLYVSKSAGSQTVIWKKDTQVPQKEVIEQMLVVNEPSSALALQPNADKLALVLGGPDGRVQVLDAANGNPLFAPILLARGMQLRAVAITADLGTLAGAACTGNGQCSQILISDSAGQQPPRVIPFSGAVTELVNTLSFNPDGTILAAGTSDGRIILYDTQTLQEKRQAVTEGMRLGTVKLSVTSVAFSPQAADLLVAGFYDGRVGLWDARNVYPIGVFDERGVGQIVGLSFYQDAEKGWMTLSVSEHGEVRRWEVDRKAWITRGCQKLRSSTAELDASASALYSDTTVASLCGAGD